MQCTSPASFGYAIGFVFKRVVAQEFTPKRSPDGTSLAENCRSELFNLLEKMSKFAALWHAIAARFVARNGSSQWSYCQRCENESKQWPQRTRN